MRNLFIAWLAATVAATVHGRTFQESFEAATSKSECSATLGRCKKMCSDKSLAASIAIIATKGKKGIETFDESTCNENCTEMSDECSTRLDEEQASAKEAAEAEAQERGARQWEMKLAKTPASFTVVCGRFTFSVWEGQGCGWGTYPNYDCAVTIANIKMSRGEYSYNINRVTGILERYSRSEREQLQCQKVVPGATKF